MTVHVNLMSALKRVRHTAADNQQGDGKKDEVAVFDEKGQEHSKRFVKDPPMKSFAVKGRE